MMIPTMMCGISSSCADGEKPKAEDVKQISPGKNVTVELKDKKAIRVIVSAVVVLREGQLEGLLTMKGTKEHEYILGADIDARDLHLALVSCGLKPGSPVKYTPEYTPASGSVVKISLRYTNKDNKVVTVPAQDWILDNKTKKKQTQDWVFGGSRIYKDPDDPKRKPIYLANYGDIVCLVNMESAMLDLTVRTPSALEERVFTAITEVIPPLGTKVEVIFEPEKKK